MQVLNKKYASFDRNIPSIKYPSMKTLLTKCPFYRMSLDESTIPTLVLSQVDNSARGPTAFSHWG